MLPGNPRSFHPCRCLRRLYIYLNLSVSDADYQLSQHLASIIRVRPRAARSAGGMIREEGAVSAHASAPLWFAAHRARLRARTSAFSSAEPFSRS